MIDTAAALAAQGLDATDLETNRAGRISEKQIARQREVRKGGTLMALLMAAMGVVVGIVGATKMLHDGQRGGAVFMIVLGLVLAAIPAGMIFAFRFVDPTKLVGCTVLRLENVEVTSFLPSSNRGIYAIGLNHKPFSGFATALAKSHLGPRVNAYVIQEHRIVLALEPRG